MNVGGFWWSIFRPERSESIVGSTSPKDKFDMVLSETWVRFDLLPISSCSWMAQVSLPAPFHFLCEPGMIHQLQSWISL
jgi:hypothetical protein